MHHPHKGLIPLLLIGTFAFAGCAKHEMVKTDAGIAPPAAAASPAPRETKSAPVRPAEPTAETPTPVSSGELKESAAKAEQAAPQAAVQQKLQTIYFGFDSSALSEEARATLVKNLEAVKKEGGATVRVEGYCDERGSDEYNLALGERRARAAAQYLESLGVPRDRLTTLSYGNEKPADPGHDEAAWSKNRRDEFVFVH